MSGWQSAKNVSADPDLVINFDADPDPGPNHYVSKRIRFLIQVLSSHQVSNCKFFFVIFLLFENYMFYILKKEKVTLSIFVERFCKIGT